MLDVIASELTEDLRKVFPGLTVEWKQSWVDITTCVLVKGDNDTEIEVWLGIKVITVAVWQEDLYTDIMMCPYGDPEAFDRIQSFISEHRSRLIGTGSS